MEALGPSHLRLATVLLVMNDVPALVAFYREVLGMTRATPVRERDTARAMTGQCPSPSPPARSRSIAAYTDATGTSVVTSRPGVWSPRSTRTIFQRVVRILAQRGSACPPLNEREWGSAVYLSDPDGNRIQIYQYRQP